MASDSWTSCVTTIEAASSASFRSRMRLPVTRERDRVEPGERLVVHDERRVERDRARERHAPLHAAGELLRHQIGRAAQSHRLELHQHQVADQRFRQLRALAHREGDVVERGQIGEERAELEQHAHLAPQLVELARPGPADRPAEHPDLALRRPQRPADQPQQRRLAAAAPAHDGDDASARDGERDAVEDRRAAVRKRDVLDLDQVCGGRGQKRGRRKPGGWQTSAGGKPTTKG